MSLCLENLTVCKNDGEPLFTAFSLEIKSGEIVTIMGPSGCGKSTLLSSIAGHLPVDFTLTGTIHLNHQNIGLQPAHKRQVGILFQDDLLFPHLTIAENLAFALPESVKGSERKQQAIEALKNISLSKLANVFPDQVSGGQRARISLTRMLLATPQAVLLDEPFSKLDKALREQFRDWVMEQLASASIPTLMVTHDEEDIPPNSRCITWPWEGETC